MILIYSIVKNDFNNSIVKIKNNLNIFLSKLNKDTIEINYLLFIVNNNEEHIINENIIYINNSILDIYQYFNDYKYCIEINQNTDLRHILDYESCEYINNIFTNNIITKNYYFTTEEMNKIIFFNKYNILNNPLVVNNNSTIFNINGLNKINWFNTIQYLYNKCIELNIDINNEKLIALYQMFYPQYTNYIEQQVIKEEEEQVIIEEDEQVIIEENEQVIIEEDEQVIIEEEQVITDDEIISELLQETIIYKKPDVWLIKKTACKQLFDNRIICIENTYLKKNCVKENKHDPYDKIYVTIGKKFKLYHQQYLSYFFVVEYHFP